MKEHQRTAFNVRKDFTNNPDLTFEEIAKRYNICKERVSQILNETDFRIVKSLNFENTFFLFTEFQEKRIKIDPVTNQIENIYDFNNKEILELKKHGFKINL